MSAEEQKEKELKGIARVLELFTSQEVYLRAMIDMFPYGGVSNKEIRDLINNLRRQVEEANEELSQETTDAIERYNKMEEPFKDLDDFVIDI